MQANLFSSGQSAELRSIQDRLRVVFGPIRDAERLDPTSQFVRSFLGAKNYDRNSWNAFWRLTRHFRNWDALADAPVSEIEALLEDVNLHEKKAPDLKAALRHIRSRAGAIDLEFLCTLDVDTALVWLEQIHGVGRKIAAATLNFSSLHKRAFVADAHVIRVLTRFGMVKHAAKTDDAYNAVMESAEGFDADDLYELHWYLKKLGQRTCRPFRAACQSCPLSDICLKRMDERRPLAALPLRRA
jgi:endonuclease-3